MKLQRRHALLADLDGEDRVAKIHIAEALSYRGETLRRAQAAA
jgi:magnesium chelatase family protein